MRVQGVKRLTLRDDSFVDLPVTKLTRFLVDAREVAIRVVEEGQEDSPTPGDHLLLRCHLLASRGDLVVYSAGGLLVGLKGDPADLAGGLAGSSDGRERVTVSVHPVEEISGRLHDPHAVLHPAA